MYLCVLFIYVCVCLFVCMYVCISHSGKGTKKATLRWIVRGLNTLALHSEEFIPSDLIMLIASSILPPENG